MNKLEEALMRELRPKLERPKSSNVLKAREIKDSANRKKERIGSAGIPKKPSTSRKQSRRRSKEPRNRDLA